MGSPKDDPEREFNETLHPVELTRAFWIKATEVTQVEWVSVMGSNQSKYSSSGVDCPVGDGIFVGATSHNEPGR